MERKIRSNTISTNKKPNRIVNFHDSDKRKIKKGAHQYPV